MAGDTTASASARVNEIAVAFIAWAPRRSMGVRMAVTGHGRVWCRVRLHLAVGMAVVHQPDFRVAECRAVVIVRSEEHTSELQSLMRISYAVFCLKNKKNNFIRKQ